MRSELKDQLIYHLCTKIVVLQIFNGKNWKKFWKTSKVNNSIKNQISKLSAVYVAPIRTRDTDADTATRKFFYKKALILDV